MLSKEEAMRVAEVKGKMAKDELQKTIERVLADEPKANGLDTNGPKSVPDRLKDLGDLYRERNALYGDNYLHFGKIMAGLFPHGLILQGEEQFNRFCLFMQCVHKMSRYARGQMKEGHPDSLDDNAVYSQLLSHFDDLCKLKVRHD